MMKKKNLITLLLLAVGSSAIAVPRSASQAREIAAKFIAQQPKFVRTTSDFKLTLETSVIANAKTRGTANVFTEFTPYYIYNVGADQGYVVVSGDDTFKDVLGYSTTGTLSADNLPEGLAYMLDFYTREMEAAKTYGTISERTHVSDSQKDVEPLIQTRWNQDDPYNMLCPITKDGKAMTGCVATGMAQLMKYYEYPAKGIGSHTNANATSCTANFGETTYDWANMTNTYGNYSSDAECNAVATLMYHCGVAVDMMYSAYASAAAGPLAAQALVNYFGYNKNILVESRDNVSLGAWKAAIFEELNARRPVMFQGVGDLSGAMGHFFVLDGYEAATGKFHFNWGWAGMYDGYFEITALQPGEGGIGGGVGSFDYMQNIFLRVQPETLGEYVSRFEAETIRPLKFNYSRGAAVQFETTNLVHNAVNFDNGKLGLGIYKDGELYMTLGMTTLQTTGFRIGTSVSSLTVSSAIPADVPDGTYQVCVVAQNEGQKNADIVRAYYNNITTWNMTISGRNITFQGATKKWEVTDENAPVLLTSDANTVYVNHEAQFSITVKNSGTTEYYDEVGVRVYKGRTSSQSQYITVPCRLAPGESRTLILSGVISVPEGDGYTAVTCYRDGDKMVDLSNKISLLVDSEENSIDGVEDSAQSVVSVEYYTVSGIQIAKPESGIAVRKTVYSNGSSKTEKIAF